MVDVENLRQGTEAGAASTVLEAAMDPGEVLGAVEYEENVLAEPAPVSVAFDSVEADVPAPAAPADADNPSRLVPSYQNQFLEISRFEIALAMYAEQTSLGRADYSCLRQVLLLLECNGQPIQDIVELPRQLSMLRDQIRKRLP